MKVPVASTVCLLTYGKRRIINSTVLEEFLIDILHLNNKLLAFVILAIYIKNGTAGICTVAKLLRVEIRNVLYVLLAMKHGIQKADEQLLVKL